MSPEEQALAAVITLLQGLDIPFMPDLDRAYMERWARDLGIFDRWARLGRRDTGR